MPLKIALSTGSGGPEFAAYGTWLTSTDIDVEIIDLTASTDPETDMEGLHALLVTGGIDIDPETYGIPDYARYSPQVDPARDRHDLAILRVAEERKLPVLGICRGSQMVNVFHGGALIPHVPEVVGNDSHSEGENGEDREHEVVLVPGTMLLEAIGVPTGRVNSAHHQAVCRFGRGMTIAARSADGIIEAVERRPSGEEGFVLAVQWHPERMSEHSNPFARGILDLFLAQALQSASRVVEQQES